jgi:hypothetical protein
VGVEAGVNVSVGGAVAEGVWVTVGVGVTVGVTVAVRVGVGVGRISTVRSCTAPLMPMGPTTE